MTAVISSFHYFTVLFDCRSCSFVATDNNRPTPNPTAGRTTAKHGHGPAGNDDNPGDNGGPNQNGDDGGYGNRRPGEGGDNISPTLGDDSADTPINETGNDQKNVTGNKDKLAASIQSKYFVELIKGLSLGDKITQLFFRYRAS